MSKETRTIASATPAEMEIIARVKAHGREIAQEGLQFNWSISTIAAIAYQRGLLDGVAGARALTPKEPTHD